jgi:hypothetical protein
VHALREQFLACDRSGIVDHRTQTIGCVPFEPFRAATYQPGKIPTGRPRTRPINKMIGSSHAGQGFAGGGLALAAPVLHTTRTPTIATVAAAPSLFMNRLSLRIYRAVASLKTAALLDLESFVFHVASAFTPEAFGEYGKDRGLSPRQKTEFIAPATR